MSAPWLWLDDACRAPGWSVSKLSDWIEDGRLPWSGYSQALRKDVTSEEYLSDFAISRIDPGNKMHVFFTDARRDDTIEGVQIVLPPDAVSSPPTNAKAAPPKPPSQTKLKAAALAAAKEFKPDNRPTFPQWKAELEKKLGREVTRKCARDVLGDLAPQLLRKRGHKRNPRS